MQPVMLRLQSNFFEQANMPDTIAVEIEVLFEKYVRYEDQ